MTTTLENPVNTQTLSQRMTQGRIPAPEGLRYALLLAEALRKIHDAGQVHGAVTPNAVALGRNGIELLQSLGSSGNITAYTAPEVVEGRAADARSDIFSFGAIVYEMLTGRQAFQGEGGELAAALATASPAPSGSPAVDRLVAACVAKDPAARVQRMQKLVLELKLLAVAVQRAEAPARKEPEDPIPGLRAEIREVEARMSEGIQRCEASIAAVNDRINEVENAVRETGVSLGSLEKSLHDRFSQFEQTVAEALARVEKGAHERVQSLEQSVGPVTNDRVLKVEQAAVINNDRIENVEHSLDALRRETSALRDAVAEDLSMFDKALKSQTASIESARTAMSQTDDLVERVVEALESLQSVVLEQTGQHA
jgi:serine/threonine protein kinase